MPQKTTDFEKALEELERLVNELEKGEMSLEQSLVQFERGVELTRACQRALKEAEQKVLKLTELTPEADLKPFDAEDNA